MQRCGTAATFRRVPLFTFKYWLAPGQSGTATKQEQCMEQSMMWHVVFAEPGELPRSRAARSRDAAIHAACELLAEGNDVRRIVEPSGAFIERAELDEHFDRGRFPGLRIPYKPALRL
jgi:hypothetical protein